MLVLKRQSIKCVYILSGNATRFHLLCLALPLYVPVHCHDVEYYLNLLRVRMRVIVLPCLVCLTLCASVGETQVKFVSSKYKRHNNL